MRNLTLGIGALAGLMMLGTSADADHARGQRGDSFRSQSIRTTQISHRGHPRGCDCYACRRGSYGGTYYRHEIYRSYPSRYSTYDIYRSRIPSQHFHRSYGSPYGGSRYGHPHHHHHHRGRSGIGIHGRGFSFHIGF